MTVNTERITHVVDVEKLARSRVGIVGIGGAMTLAGGLVRSGVGGLRAIDPDRVDASNVARQGHHQVGELKVKAAENILRAINPNLDYVGWPLRHDQVSEEQWEELLVDVDLLIFTTDSFEAQAFGNRLAL